MRRWLRFLAYGAALLAALAIALLWWTRPHTPSVRDDAGREVPGAVASLETILLGDAEQWILVRGRPDRPIVLFLHGGPGMTMMWMAHRFQRPLEDEFLLVQWDQRGAGKSYANPPPPETMTDERILADALELVDTLRSRYGQERVLLVGHSWGSYVGTLFARRHPERLHAYVGIGQVTGDAARDSIVEAWLLERAREAGRYDEVAADLEANESAAFESWLFQFGGELHGETGFTPFIVTGLKAPEYSLRDVFRVGPGSSWSSANMKEIAIEGPLGEAVDCLAVPVWLFLGRNDYVTPSELGAAWLEELRAPRKETVWFDEAAHFPHYERPEAFADALREVWGAVEGREPTPRFCDDAPQDVAAPGT